MEEMKNLRDLLKHELEDLYSAEEQILEGLPSMIEKAENQDLKTSLNDHFKVTEQQKLRLDKIKKMLGEEAAEEDKGFFAKLFTGEKHHCRGMEGLLEEGEKMMEEDMEPEVRDAAIIAAAQKIEHYEISGYGTAKAFALHLGLQKVASLLNETLQEEYEADILLTDLAIGDVNLEAADEEGEEIKGLKKLPGGRSKTAGSKTPARKSSAKTSPAKSSNGKSGNSKKSNSSGGSRTHSKKSSTAPSRGGSSRAKSGSSRSRGR